MRVLFSFTGGNARHDSRCAVVCVGQRFEPDVVVRDEVDFGAAVAAERSGIPHASVVVLAAGGMIAPGYWMNH